MRNVQVRVRNITVHLKVTLCTLIHKYEDLPNSRNCNEKKLMLRNSKAKVSKVSDKRKIGDVNPRRGRDVTRYHRSPAARYLS